MNNCQCLQKTPGYGKCHRESLGSSQAVCFPGLGPVAQPMGWPQAPGHPHEILGAPWGQSMKVPYVLRVGATQQASHTEDQGLLPHQLCPPAQAEPRVTCANPQLTRRQCPEAMETPTPGREGPGPSHVLNEKTDSCNSRQRGDLQEVYGNSVLFPQDLMTLQCFPGWDSGSGIFRKMLSDTGVQLELRAPDME